uniref:TSA: Wollemia nobilis Ref_Wollemi_Transcript_25362_400 transcribed RNA sequence n=1 Tax=Wollemia nobilis TaxID=56998 RepID=A0A0C9RGW2_9CONI
MESLGVLKHVLLVKFKDNIPPGRIEDLIKAFANLVNLIEPLKSFEWGEDVSCENLQQGFTHVFECMFDTTEDRDAYLVHPAHVEFGNQILPAIEKFIVVDYKPTRII